jgi:uncharacterized protein (DUF58 family)
MKSEPSVKIRSALDWGELVPLRLRARSVADGVYAGGHRSPRRGAGIEFGGHRNYVPGDDLRWLDRHALMRHGRLMIREFETETDRALCLIVDASLSMGFRSAGAPGAKLAYAAVLAAALARIAIAGGDPVGLEWIGGGNPRALPVTGGREAFERLVGTLEAAQAGGSLELDSAGVDRVFAAVARNAGRGSVIVLFSDLIDLPPDTLERFAGLSTRGRTLVAVRVLDPVEARFPFEGPLRLRAVEADTLVETDGEAARAGYLAALERAASAWSTELVRREGQLVRAVSDEDGVQVVRSILRAAEGFSP